MSRKNKIYSVRCPKIIDILANHVTQRLSLAATTGLHPSHFEPQSLPSIAFEFDAIINGYRYQGLKGEADIGHGQPTFRIDFPEGADQEKWASECRNRLLELLFKALEK